MGCESTPDKPTVKIGEQKWTVKIADEPAEREYGLMYRDHLNEGSGMLFIFPTEGAYSFWMKNTLIPLDIVWISADFKVVDTATMDPCQTEACPSYVPDGRAQYVLEVNAGEFKGKVGDTVQLNHLTDS